MPNIKLVIEYDGTKFYGWQVQGKKENRKRTVQGEIEKALLKILGEKISLIGSGRTDSGVHALGQVANFKTVSMMKPDAIMRALNGNLPEDITIISAEKVKSSFHAIKSVKAKTYQYQILNQVYRRSIGKGYFWRVPYKLNLSLMKKELKALLGKHDFKAFESSGAPRKNSIRIIKRISLSKKGNNLTLKIEGNGFLYNMVRNITGTLVEIGRGHFSAGSMKKILKSKNRRNAGPTAPARGLFLVKVKY